MMSASSTFATAVIAQAPQATPIMPSAGFVLPVVNEPATPPVETDICLLGCVTLLASNKKVSITEVQKSNGVDDEITR